MIEIPHVPIHIPQKHSEKAFKTLLSTVKPHWPHDNILIRYFTKGTTNTIISATFMTHDEATKKFSYPPDVVLARVYGNRTEVIIDRRREIENMVAMWALGCGSELYCTFENGLCYGYAPGFTITTLSVRDPLVYPLIAQTLAQMHSAFRDRSALPRVVRRALPGSTSPTSVHEQTQPQPCLFPTLRKWAALLLPFLEAEGGPTNGTTPRHNGGDTDICILPAYSVDPKERLLCELPVDPWAEIDYLEGALIPLNSPVVFCHNDLLFDNIIYDPDTGKMTFIDLEYGDFNYQAFDIAHFFCEFAGMENVDYGLFPERSYRLEWLTVYWREWQAQTSGQGHVEAQTDADRERDEVVALCEQVDRFILAPHLYWAVWAILQSRVSDKPFDYFSFAKIRLAEYAKIKADPSVLDK